MVVFISLNKFQGPKQDHGFPRLFSTSYKLKYFVSSLVTSVECIIILSLNKGSHHLISMSISSCSLWNIFFFYMFYDYVYIYCIIGQRHSCKLLNWAEIFTICSWIYCVYLCKITSKIKLFNWSNIYLKFLPRFCNCYPNKS